MTGEQTHDSLNVVGIEESTLTVHKKTSINNFTETWVPPSTATSLFVEYRLRATKNEDLSLEATLTF